MEMGELVTRASVLADVQAAVVCRIRQRLRQGMPQCVEDLVVGPRWERPVASGSPVHRRQQRLLVDGGQARGHVREPQEHRAADEGAMLAAHRAAPPDPATHTRR